MSGKRANEHLEVLAPLDRADDQNRSAIRRPSFHRAKIAGDAGIDDVHAIGVEPVEHREQLAARELRIDDDA